MTIHDATSFRWTFPVAPPGAPRVAQAARDIGPDPGAVPGRRVIGASKILAASVRRFGLLVVAGRFAL